MRTGPHRSRPQRRCTSLPGLRKSYSCMRSSPSCAAHPIPIASQRFRTTCRAPACRSDAPHRTGLERPVAGAGSRLLVHHLVAAVRRADATRNMLRRRHSRGNSAKAMAAIQSSNVCRENATHHDGPWTHLVQRACAPMAEGAQERPRRLPALVDRRGRVRQWRGLRPPAPDWRRPGIRPVHATGPVTRETSHRPHARDVPTKTLRPALSLSLSLPSLLHSPMPRAPRTYVQVTGPVPPPREPCRASARVREPTAMESHRNCAAWREPNGIDVVAQMCAGLYQVEAFLRGCPFWEQPVPVCGLCKAVLGDGCGLCGVG